jgi:hypothetical protein
VSKLVKSYKNTPKKKNVRPQQKNIYPPQQNLSKLGTEIKTKKIIEKFEKKIHEEKAKENLNAKEDQTNLKVKNSLKTENFKEICVKKSEEKLKTMHKSTQKPRKVEKTWTEITKNEYGRIKLIKVLDFGLYKSTRKVKIKNKKKLKSKASEEIKITSGSESADNSMKNLKKMLKTDDDCDRKKTHVNFELKFDQIQTTASTNQERRPQERKSKESSQENLMKEKKDRALRMSPAGKLLKGREGKINFGKVSKLKQVFEVASPPELGDLFKMTKISTPQAAKTLKAESS